MSIEYDREDLEGSQEDYLASLTEEERAWQDNHTGVPVSEMIMVYCNHYDITKLVTEITWSGSKDDVARKLDVKIVSDDNYYFPDFTVEMHDLIQFFLNGCEVFRGYVMDVDRSLNDKTITYVCYDAGIFLTKSKGKYKFYGETPDNVTRTVCKDFEIPVKETQPGVSYQRIHDNDSIYDIIMTGYTLTSQSNGKQYYLSFERGALSVLEKGKIVCKYLLSSEREITDASFQASSLNAVNRVKAYNSDGTEAGTFQIDSDYDFPGVLQAVYKQSNGEEIETAAKALLQDVELTASIDAIGVLECVTGRGVVVSEPVTGLDGLFYIDSDTHKFANGIHTMSLDIAFENVMDQVLAGSVEQTSGSEALGIGGNTVQERVYNFFRAKGFSAAAACGVMGNIQVESGFDATIEEIGNAIGYGLCQWSFERRTNLVNWCNNNGRDYTTVEGQLDYLIYELEGGDSTCASLMNQYCSGFEGFKQITDVAWATQVFQICFERAGIPNMQNRISAAQGFYNKWKNYTKIPPSTGGLIIGGDGSGAATGRFGWPFAGGAGTVTQGFSGGYGHRGWDISTRSGYGAGSPVLAVDGGVVVGAAYQLDDWSYGNAVTINHGNGLCTRYAHLYSINVSAGQRVSKGQQIGVEGNTGNSFGTHLHFEVLNSLPWGALYNPGNYLHRYG